MVRRGLDILLIEDNPGDVRLIEEMLAEADDRSGDGDAAGSVLHEDHLDDGLARLDEADVDVVLLDLGLPDSTGIATLETVRSRARDVPVVVLTGLDDERVGDQAVQRGAQEYLVKDELTPALLGRSLRHAIERKQFERTQTALHRASRDLIQAESDAEVSRLAVDTAVDVLGLQGIAIYLFDDESNTLRPTASTDYVEALFGELTPFGPEDTAITWEAFITGETIAHDDVREADDVHRTDTPLRSGLWIPLGDHGVMSFVAEELAGFDQQRRQLADHLAATTEATLDRLERETSLREHERELTEQNELLAELNRMNEIIREIDQALVEASTRDGIEQAVCDLLTSPGRFAFAWIGQPVGGERVEPRTWAGDDRGYLDAVSLATGGADAPPAVTTATTGTVTFAPNVAENLRSAPWRKVALARDLQSAVSVPLTHADVSYGVLTVFATEPGAFDGRSEAILAELGETIANAMNAVETRRALLTDTVVELELVIHEPDDALSLLAREANCEIEYGGFVPQADGTDRLFFTASGTSTGDIRAVADGVPSVRRLEAITDGDDDGDHRFEMTVSGQTIPSTLADSGAAVRSLQVEESLARVVVELPDGTDVRGFIDRLEGTYPRTELVARRDDERTSGSRGSFDTELTDELTPRQLETLQTAYHSGYFEWPRDRTGEDVAESLGITQPTFNGHLRAAERKLCAMLFDDAAPSPD